MLIRAVAAVAVLACTATAQADAPHSALPPSSPLLDEMFVGLMKAPDVPCFLGPATKDGHLTMVCILDHKADAGAPHSDAAPADPHQKAAPDEDKPGADGNWHT